MPEAVDDELQSAVATQEDQDDHESNSQLTEKNTKLFIPKWALAA